MAKAKEQKQTEPAAPVEKKQTGMVFLKFSGKKYNGFEIDSSAITALNGETLELTCEKADQLICDFPHEWERV